MRRPILLTVLTMAVACGGGEDVGDPDGRLGSAGSVQRPASTDSAGHVGDAGAPSVPAAPTDTGAWVMEPPAPNAGPQPHPWVSGRSSGGTRASGVATLLAVRTARQDGYDRVVFEFDTHVPEWRADYVDSPQYECGSGEAVRLAGDGWLRVDFEMTNAHTEEGRATAAPRHVPQPAGTNLRELRRICDFEAQTQYVIGVGSPNDYRAFQLTGPARLVVDIRH